MAIRTQRSATDCIPPPYRIKHAYQLPHRRQGGNHLLMKEKIQKRKRIKRKKKKEKSHTAPPNASRLRSRQTKTDATYKNSKHSHKDNHKNDQGLLLKRPLAAIKSVPHSWNSTGEGGVTPHKKRKMENTEEKKSVETALGKASRPRRRTTSLP